MGNDYIPINGKMDGNLTDEDLRILELLEEDKSKNKKMKDNKPKDKKSKEESRESVECYLNVEEIKALNILQEGERYSKAWVLEHALLHFEEHPTEVDIPPRAKYRRTVQGLRKSPFTVEKELYERLKCWLIDYSASQNQIIRHALKQYALSKNVSIGKESEDSLPIEWASLKLSSSEAAELAKTDRNTINKNGNLERYPFLEVYGRGPRPKKLYILVDIVRHYHVSQREVEEFLRKHESVYKTLNEKYNNL